MKAKIVETTQTHQKDTQKVVCVDKQCADLHRSAAEGDTEKVKQILEGGTDEILINLQDQNGDTSLHIAMVHNKHEVVRYLIARGANLEARNYKGNTALSEGIRCRSRESLNIFSEGANVDYLTPEELLLYGFLSLKEGVIKRALGGIKEKSEVAINLDLSEWDSKALQGAKDLVLSFTQDLAIIKADLLLRLAVSVGCVSLIKKIDIDPTTLETLKDKWGRELIHIASIDGYAQVIEMLLHKGAKIDAIQTTGDLKGATPLLLAACNGRVDAASFLVEGGANIDAAMADGVNKGATSLWMAARNGHIEIVKLLVEKGAKIDVAIADGVNKGKTPLWVAVQNRRIEESRFLIGKGAEVDAANSEGKTSLLIAAQNGHVGMVELLVEKGANIDAAVVNGISKGKTPLLIAVQNGHVDIVRLLVERGANVNSIIVNGINKGKTPLWLAVQDGCIEIAKFLIEKGANIDVAAVDGENKGATLLWIAVRNGYTDVVKSLVEKGADIDVAIRDGDRGNVTPLLIALQNGYREILGFLLSYIIFTLNQHLITLLTFLLKSMPIFAHLHNYGSISNSKLSMPELSPASFPNP